MAEVELTEAFLAKIGGWEAVKAARHLLANGKVLSSNYTPPVLKGVVQEGTITYRSGLVLKSGIDLENLCSCRASRDWGTICAHSVAVGLHHLKPPAVEVSQKASEPVSEKARSAGSLVRLRRATADEPSAEPLELHIIVPPNFVDAAARGRVMVVIEGKWSRGRVPLNTLSREQPFQLSAEDERLLNRVEELAGEPAGMLVITTREFVELLPALMNHPRITLGKGATVRVLAEPWMPALRAELQANGEIVLSAKSGNQPLTIDDRWVIANNTLQPLGLSKEFLGVMKAPVRITRQQVPAFLNNEWPKLATAGARTVTSASVTETSHADVTAGASIEANFTLDDFTVAPQAPEILLNLAGGLAQLAAQLQFKYGARIVNAGASASAESPWMPDSADVKRYAMRDFCAEQQANARLMRAGFGPDTQGRLQLNGNDRVLSFFAREFPRMQKEWRVTLEERLQRSTTEKMERIEPRFEITPSGVQWFDFGVGFASSGGEQFSAADIQRLILSGQSHTRLRNGKVAVIDTGAVEELQQFLLDASPTQQGGKYRIGNAQAGFLESTLQQQGWVAQAPQSWRERAKQQSGEAKIECPPLGNLESVLRPYQKHGVAWMNFLRTNGFGGILADEMGLGKTLQTLAFIQICRRRREESQPNQSLVTSPPTLVICPTSLVFNWVAEAQKFTPELKVVALQGSGRHKLFDAALKSDLVVTSYGLIRRDWERHAGVEYDTVILDEAQHIKNRQTQNAQAVKAIRSTNRLVLTGTPLENSVLDLWSIFDFLMPGYLGNAKDFKERYEVPITREKNAEAQARLSRRLRPFILRRLKRDVAKDLPDKIEQVTFCELNDEQRALYQQVMEFSRKEVLEAVGAQGFAKSRMVVFTALLRLRQICCDLRLLNVSREERERDDVTESSTETSRSSRELSGKVEAFDELLQEIVDGGHRVLVFSQFVSMLTILKERLREQEVEFCYLDGSTTNRGEVVQQFQSSATPVFLISLKAGGVGLNLTGADTVIHFDPWWNPAVEDQATDRAHRIGQSRVVTSYKLITRGTVEEKILTLQQKKREIIKATLGEEEFTSALSWDEIQELFS
ncbi:MAG TPA: SNF2-related protein [Candidatus Acidoferrum sp.]|nr:SNF2-related protein [Candidatus Acidoferrum sp.]